MSPLDESIPLDAGGNPQPDPEPAPAQAMNISEASQALLDALSAPEAPEALEEMTLPVEAPTGQEGSPNPPEAPEPPAKQVSLDAVKDDILSGIKDMLGANQQGPEPQAPDAPEPEPLEAILTDDVFMEKFSENPAQAVMELAKTIADKQVASEMAKLAEQMKPLLDQSEQIAFQDKIKDTLSEFLGNEEFSDAQDHFPRMAEMIKSGNLPQDDPNTYRNTYYRAALEAARASQQGQQAQPKSLDDYLADEDEVQKVLGNDKIKTAVITEYLKNLANNNRPQVINGSGNVLPPATPPKKITGFREASKMLRSQL